MKSQNNLVSFISTFLLIITSNRVLSHSDDDWIGLENGSDICFVSTENKLYGMKTNYFQSIDYFYSMEYGVKNGSMDLGRIVKSIEHTISDMILISTSLFEKCNLNTQESRSETTNANHKDRRKLYQQRKKIRSIERKLSQGEVVGLSSNPEDAYISQDCSFMHDQSSLNNGDSKCALVKGQLTVYFDRANGKILQKQFDEIQSLIQKLMIDGGRLPRSYSDIYKLEYHGSKQEELNGSNGARNAVLISVASILFVGLVGFGGYYKWSQRRGGEETIFSSHGAGENVEAERPIS